ncbi:MAG TPA: hypothetical protein VD884_00270 [Ohtaekwangia sp.]|nr:hypothetical protein [Ohtaekwangia sp.]
MKYNLITFFLVVTMMSCDNSDTMKVVSLHGTYEGVFFRTTNGSRDQTSYVTVTFDENKFEGSGSIVKYPAICNGTYTLAGNEVEFVNLCVWTADFDWSFILSGKFTITKNGNEIILTRQINNDVRDTYKLTR